MENSPLIGATPAPLQRDSFYAFISGERPERHSAPQRIAWQLEDWASRLGWPAGQIIGSEETLGRQMGVSRETLREAIRIGERRGSMQMIRGRYGGLTIARPDLAQCAVSLAIYLRLIGCTEHQARDTTAALDQVCRDIATGLDSFFVLRVLRLAIDANDLLLRTLARTRNGMPAEIRPAFLNPHTSSAVIAMQLMDHALERGGSDRRIGSEWELSERFGTSRTMIRQALRMLSDFDMIESHRGRGGGAFARQPAPVGIIRQIYPALASEVHSVKSVAALISTLNIVHLNLAATKLAVLNVQEREMACRHLVHVIETAREPARRWVLLQQAIAAVAAAPMVDTLLRCVVSYQARVFVLPPPSSDRLSAGMHRHERTIVAALMAGDTALARAHQDAAQKMLGDAIADCCPA